MGYEMGVKYTEQLGDYMGNIFEAIRILSFSSKVGSSSKIKTADGKVVDCITESLSKRKGTAKVSCELNGHNYLIELTLKPSSNNKVKSDTEKSNYPEAVYTVSGKLVYLAGTN
jgi:hypothetical protein